MSKLVGGTEVEPRRHVYLWVTAIFACASALAVIVTATFTTREDFANTVGVTVVAGGAAFWSAGLLGYLFGIPRWAASSGEREAFLAKGDLTANNGGALPYVANTNLEQVSDWITKIAVGIGLVEARSVGSFVNEMGRDVSASLGITTGVTTIGTSLLIVEAACGFIFFYLWSRLYMPQLFSQSERLALEAGLRRRDAE